MITVLVHTPLDVDGLPRAVSDDGLLAPVVGGSVVIDIDAGVEAAWAAASDWGYVKIGPSGDGLKDIAFWACIDLGLLRVRERTDKCLLYEIKAHYLCSQSGTTGWDYHVTMAKNK
jgi:hypothetical protein